MRFLCVYIYCSDKKKGSIYTHRSYTFLSWYLFNQFSYAIFVGHPITLVFLENNYLAKNRKCLSRSSLGHTGFLRIRARQSHWKGRKMATDVIVTCLKRLRPHFYFVSLHFTDPFHLAAIDAADALKLLLFFLSSPLLSLYLSISLTVYLFTYLSIYTHTGRLIDIYIDWQTDRGRWMHINM